MDWYSILGIVFKSILWAFVVFCVTWCFFSAYKQWLLCCDGVGPPRPQQVAIATAVVATRSDAVDSPPARGLQAWEIEDFPKFGYPPPDAAGVEMSREITDCVVCLGAFREGETLRLIPKCGHVFHADCVDVWLRAHATCPCCRACLNSPSTVETSRTASESPV